MTLPPVIRVFFAIDLPQSTRNEVGKFISSLKKKSRSHAIRWTRPENLHITLQFLAEVRSEHLAAMIANVRKEVKDLVKNTSFSLTEVQLFPSVFRPRVIVLNVKPQAELAKLSGLIGRGIQATQYEIESRAFRAHMTLGRIKQPQGMDLGFLSGAVMHEIESLPVKEVVLFRSEPQPEGSRYSVVERISL